MMILPEQIRQNAGNHPILSFGEGGDVYADKFSCNPQSTQFNLHTPG